jgi:hypothetical protein
MTMAQDALAARDRLLVALDALEADMTAAVNAGSPIFVSGLYGAVRDVRAALVADISVRLGRLWARNDVIQEVYAQAIAARLVVHELDANNGRAPRQFEPLPPYPSAPAEPTSEATAPHSAVPNDIKKEV